MSYSLRKKLKSNQIINDNKEEKKTHPLYFARGKKKKERKGKEIGFCEETKRGLRDGDIMFCPII